MTHRDHHLLLVLALLGFATALFQAWYVYLPVADAAAFDLCRLSPAIDCFESLHRFGTELRPYGIPTFPALAGLYLFVAALTLLAYFGAGATREAWLAAARIAAFPAAGLGVYVVIFFLTRKTPVSDPSTILLTLVSLALCAHLVWRGLGASPVGRGLPGTLGFAAAGVAAAFFLHGAGASRLALQRIELEREGAPPQLRLPEFARTLPREGAAFVGSELAHDEVLLFVDPADERSREVMRHAARLAGRDDVYVVLYAPGEAGARLIAAHRAGELRAWLENPGETIGDVAAARPLAARQQEALRELGVDAFPQARTRAGVAAGAFRLAEVITAARRSS